MGAGRGGRSAGRVGRRPVLSAGCDGSLIQQIRHVLQMPHPQPAELLEGDFPDSLPTGGRIVAAAVLMAIVEHPRTTLILTRRTDTLRRHAGQVAFPGGRVDPEDSGIVAAALREADEEVGLPPDKVDVIGVLEPYQTVTGFLVTPVVGVVPPGMVLVPTAAELARVFRSEDGRG